MEIYLIKIKMERQFIYIYIYMRGARDLRLRVHMCRMFMNVRGHYAGRVVLS